MGPLKSTATSKKISKKKEKKMGAGLREKVMVSSCAKRRHTAKVAGKQPILVVSSAYVRPACLPLPLCWSSNPNQGDLCLRSFPSL